MYGKRLGSYVDSLPPKEPLRGRFLRMLVPASNMHASEHGRCVDDGHMVADDEFLIPVVRLPSAWEAGGVIEPEDAEVDVARIFGADFEDAGDAEGGVRVLLREFGVGRTEDVDGGTEGEGFIVDLVGSGLVSGGLGRQGLTDELLVVV